MGEMKQINLNFVVDHYEHVKASRKKKIFATRSLKTAIEKNKIVVKESIIADSKKWDAKKLQKAIQRQVAGYYLKAFDVACKELDDVSTVDKNLEKEIVESHRKLMKKIRKLIDTALDEVANDKPDDKKLKKGVDALKQLDPRAAKSAYSKYGKWMKRCERNWANIAKLETGIKKHEGLQRASEAEAAKQEKKKGGGGNEDAKGEDNLKKAKDGASQEQKVVENLTKKRDELLAENKNLYREETALLMRALEGACTQLKDVSAFATEMKRNPQISDAAQKALAASKGFFKTIKAQEKKVKTAQSNFDATMTKLDRAKNPGARPSHKALMVPQSVAAEIEKVCKEAGAVHKKLGALYKAAK